MFNLLDGREFVCWILNEEGFWEQQVIPIGVLYYDQEFNKDLIRIASRGVSGGRAPAMGELGEIPVEGGEHIPGESRQVE